MKRCFLLVLAGVFLAAGPAAAEGKLEPPDLDRYLRWGPLRARPGIEVSNVGYDDNILYGSSADRLSDYTATVSPRLEGLFLLGHRAFFTFREQLDYTLYVSNSDQNFLNSRGSGRLTVPLGRVGVFTDFQVENVEFRPEDRNDVRPERRVRGAGLGVIWQPGWRMEIELSRSLTDLRHLDPDVGATIAERLDRDEQTNRLEVSYRLLGRTKLLLDGLFKRIDFDEPTRFPVPSLDGLDRDTREERLLVGVEFGEGGPLTGTARLGRGTIDARAAALPDFDEVIGTVDLAYRFSRRTRLQLEAERIPGFSVFESNSYFLQERASVRGVHYINRLIGFEARTEQGRLTFPESTPGSNRVDDYTRLSAGIRLRLSENSLGRRIEYSLTYSRYRRESTEAFAQQSQNTFGIGAVLGF